jgi:multiple sugar transport system substrate-binding protein
MLVNKKHFNDAGITDMPTTLDELVADAKQIKAKGITQYPIGLPLSTTEGASTSWYLLTKAFGGDLFDKDFKPLFLTPDSAGYKAMAFEMQLLKDGLVDPASTGLRDAQINDNYFAKGQTSIMISGEPGRLGQYSDPAQSQVAGQVEAILVPTASGTTRSYGLLEALAVPKVSQHQDAAIAFVKWFTSKEFQIENYQNGVLPTRTSALDELNKAGKLKSGDALVEESKYVEALFAQGTPTWYPQFSSAVNTAINAVAKGQVTVDQAMQNIADATKKAMTE